MGAVLAVLIVADIALAVLLVAVSGFILQGVNNTGPMMPESIFYVALILACVVAPVIAVAMHRKRDPAKAIIIALLPLVAAGLAMAIEPS